MKAAPLLLYALAAGRECPGEIPEPVSLTDAAVARATAAAAWFRGAPPPRHWTLTASLARDLNQTLGAGAYKRVIEVVDRPELLVKTRVHAALHKQALDHRGERAVRAEVLYLEVAPAPGCARAVRRLDRPGEGALRRARSASLVWSGTMAPGCRPAAAEAAKTRPSRRRGARSASGRLRMQATTWRTRRPQFTPNDAGVVFAIDAPESPGAPVAATLTPRSGGPKTPPGGPTAPGAGEELFPTTTRRTSAWSGAARDRIRGFEAARERRGAAPPGDVGVDARTHARPGDADARAAHPAGGRFPSSAEKRRLELIARM